MLPTWSVQFSSHNSPAQLPSHSQLPQAQEPAARAAVMLVWLPWPEQPQSVAQNCPMKLLWQTQPPAAHEPAARATVMFVWLPWPEHPHSVLHSSPIQLPVQLAQAKPSTGLCNIADTLAQAATPVGAKALGAREGT